MAILTSLELCAGAGGQALGFDKSGFHHEGLVEIDAHCCQTLRLNRPKWNVIEGDLANFSGKNFQGIDILTGGLPCPPFSVAGKQLGSKDERNLFPEGLRLVHETRPRAVMFENVRGFLDPSFLEYRDSIKSDLKKMGYVTEIKLINCSDYGVCQLRPRVMIVAIRKDLSENFSWPEPQANNMTVGRLLYDLMQENGWDAKEWRKRANTIAPTLVGGSKKHGGPDLGPTRAKKAWMELGVDGKGIADSAPSAGSNVMPRLTNRMVARIQGFDDSWIFAGKKTAAYRQIGNAFPPPAAKAMAEQLSKCLKTKRSVAINNSENKWQKLLKEQARASA